MAKNNEKPPIYMTRKGDYLLPEMAMDAEAIRNLPERQRVKVQITEPRNSGRLRAYWAMLNEVVKATDCAPTAEALHELVKLETGFVIHVRLGKGLKVELPGSIAFDKISEAEMEAFFRSAEAFLAREYGWVKEMAA
jgi:hypothetical protein